MQHHDDIIAIRQTVTDYLEGMIYGEPARLREAFHPGAIQAGHFKGNYEFLSAEQFIESLENETMQPPGSAYSADIISIDRTGDTAVAKVSNSCFGTDFIDYLTLIKDNGRWQIICKAFYDQANANKA